MERPNCRYKESLGERVRDAVSHEKELESKLPEPEARRKHLEQVERASTDVKEGNCLVRRRFHQRLKLLHCTLRVSCTHSNNCDSGHDR